MNDALCANLNTCPRRVAALVLCGFCVSSLFTAIALKGDEAAGRKVEDSSESAARKKQREENLKAMEQRARGTKVHVDAKPHGDPELIPQPLFHYTDEPRRILDATLWGWFDEGRLQAICKIELYEDRSLPQGRWLYCFGSLSSALVSAEWADGHRWAATKPGIQLRPLEGAPAPAEGKAARLRQMKELAGRFGATLIDEPVNKREKMRLLPRPLYRYEAPAGESLDGAVFGLTSNGTNPDAILVIELQRSKAGAATEWAYGVAGMTTGGLALTLDDKEVWAKAGVPASGTGGYDTWAWFWEHLR